MCAFVQQVPTRLPHTSTSTTAIINRNINNSSILSRRPRFHTKPVRTKLLFRTVPFISACATSDNNQHNNQQQQQDQLQGNLYHQSDLLSTTTMVNSNSEQMLSTTKNKSTIMALLILELLFHFVLAIIAITVSIATQRRSYAILASTISICTIILSIFRLRLIRNNKIDINFNSSLLLKQSKQIEERIITSFKTILIDEISSLRSMVTRNENNISLRDRTFTKRITSLDINIKSLQASIDSMSDHKSISILTELENARSNVKEANLARERERLRANAADAAKTEATRLAEKATTEADAAVHRELKLRSQAATDAIKLTRLEQLSKRLNSTERIVDDLKDQLLRTTREAERYRLIVQQNENQIETSHRLTQVLRQRLDEIQNTNNNISARPSAIASEDDEEMERLQDTDLNWDLKSNRSRRNIKQDSSINGFEDYGPGMSSDSAKLSWPMNPLGEKKENNNNIVQNQILQGLPSDGGFGTAEDEPLKLGQSENSGGVDNDDEDDEIIQEDKAFSFSRGEFDSYVNPPGLPSSVEQDVPSGSSEEMIDSNQQMNLERNNQKIQQQTSPNSTDSLNQEELRASQDSDFEPNTRVDLPNAAITSSLSQPILNFDQNHNTIPRSESVPNVTDINDWTNKKVNTETQSEIIKESKSIISQKREDIEESQASSMADSGPYEHVDVLDDNLFDSSPLRLNEEFKRSTNLSQNVQQSTGNTDFQVDSVNDEDVNMLSKEITDEAQSPATQSSDSGAKASDTLSTEAVNTSNPVEGSTVEPEVAGMYDDASESDTAEEEVNRPNASIAAAKMSLQNLLKTTKSGTLDESDDGSLGIGENAEEEIIEEPCARNMSGISAMEEQKYGSSVTPDDNVSESSASEVVRKQHEESQDVNVQNDDNASPEKEEVITVQQNVEPDAMELSRKAKELVRKGRRRGLTVTESDSFFEEASKKLKQALRITDDKAYIEGELGACLLAWAKANVADSAISSRLSRALGHLTNSLDVRPKDETTLFNCGLCLCLLGSTSEKGMAKKYYEQACQLYDRVLSGNPDSRVGAFNCGLAYVSLGRLAVMESEKNDEIISHFQNAIARFEKSLLLKPDDSKATSYLRDCQRQIEELQKYT